MTRLALLVALCAGACSIVTEPGVGSPPVPEAGCWLMAVDGVSPRSELIRLTSERTSLDTTRTRQRYWMRARDKSTIPGTWTYAWMSNDSIYVRLGNTVTGYWLWLGRDMTAPPAQAAWIGGVRVYVKEGEAWNGTARLTRASCRG